MPPDPTVLIYQWQAKGLVRPHVELGLQGFGNFGPRLDWTRFNGQAHSIGPALFVKVPVAGQNIVAFDAAVLVGLTSESPRTTLRLRTKYAF